MIFNLIWLAKLLFYLQPADFQAIPHAYYNFRLGLIIHANPEPVLARSCLKRHRQAVFIPQYLVDLPIVAAIKITAGLVVALGQPPARFIDEMNKAGVIYRQWLNRLPVQGDDDPVAGGCRSRLEVIPK